jgi:poly-beta-1,6-N-acetyl-D-glucosamine N-deacetylase
MYLIRYCLPIFFLLITTSASAANHCVILQYHHFSDQTPRSTSITREQFAEQLNYLAENDFKVMALRDVAISLYHQLELPDKCVSLSVDDAYISVYETAYPMLREHNWPLTVFVSSENDNHPSSLYMNWQQMREMAQHGVSFENHGYSHTHMIRHKAGESDSEWLARMRADILQSQKQITKEIGVTPELFAWPYGEFNTQLGNLISELGLTGFGQQSGPAWSDANFVALPRFPMAAEYANLDGFIIKVNSLPLPVVKALPLNPELPPGDLRPTLTLTLAPRSYSRANLTCFIDGSNEIQMTWSDQHADQLEVTPLFDLKPGRHRTNCTMPSRQKGRFHWYSHNWIVRNADGSWYDEY